MMVAPPPPKPFATTGHPNVVHRITAKHKVQPFVGWKSISILDSENFPLRLEFQFACFLKLRRVLHLFRLIDLLQAEAIASIFDLQPFLKSPLENGLNFDAPKSGLGKVAEEMIPVV